MKPRTRAEKINDFFTAFKCTKEGKPVKRTGARDGSIVTHSVVPVSPHKFEHMVLADCLAWLKKHHIFCNRHDVGAGDFGHGYATYGIKGAGDIIGILPAGVHFEIEVKRGKGGRLSKGQQKRMRDVRATNGVYLVVHGIEELKHYFEGLI